MSSHTPNTVRSSRRALRSRPGRFVRRALSVTALAVGGLFLSGHAQAVPVASWTSPSAALSYLAGDLVVPTGNANASGVIGGTGLDLALVLDSSGSMTTVASGRSRREWLQLASTALVNALPVSSTSVAVIDFDDRALLRQGLTPISTGKAAIETAIRAVDASGGTNIGTGIDRARVELLGANHAAGRATMMVVVSDGESSGLPASNAAASFASGVSAIHAVGLPGHSISTMRGIATAGNGIYTSVNDLTGLIDLFNGTAGNLVGIDRVDVTMNDGTVLTDIGLDGLGNFTLPAARLHVGANVFTAQAYDTLGNRAEAVLTLNALQPVPEPGTYALFAVGGVLLALAAHRRRQVA